MLSGLFGGNAGRKEMKESNQLLRDQVARLEAIGIPTIEAQKIALADDQYAGDLDAQQLNPSELENLRVNQGFLDPRIAALQEMRQLGETGFGAVDLAALDQIKRSASGQAQAQKDSALQQMAAQGMMDSGSSLIAQLGAAQAAADRVSQQGMQQAAQAAQARRAAISDSANMAANLSAEDLGIQNTRLSATDSINRFNKQNRQAVDERNLGARQGNLSQSGANRRTEEMYNKGLVQQQFQNQLSKATGVNQATGNLAGNLQQQAGAAQQAQQAMVSGITGLAGTLGGAALKANAGGGAASAKTAVSGMGQSQPTSQYDDFYMNKLK